ncbi:cytochrome c3 family protein [Psychromonas sp.]|uniref:cytochrome c3 family protein n=1 Tax=Psychromonas sp. TaxID=1884585 RepID=UPI0039E60269
MHVEQISCAGCHQLHSQKDPMQGVQRKTRTAFCIACHKNKITTRQESTVTNHSQNREEQEWSIQNANL